MKPQDRQNRSRALTLRPGAAVYAVLWIYALIMTQLLRNPASAVFFWFIVLVLPVSFIAMLIAFACIQVYVFTDRNAAEKLTDVEYEVRIINSSPLPIPFAEAITVLPQDSGVRCVKERLVLSLPPFGGYSVKTDVRFRYRGLYEIGVEEVYVYDPLRIFRIRKRIRNYSNITVLPRTLETDFGEERAVSDIPSPSSRSISTRETAETANIREYRAGDPLKSIHWKLSSKSEELQVRDFNTNDDRQTYILIDFAAPTPAPQSDEKSAGKAALFSASGENGTADTAKDGKENAEGGKIKVPVIKRLGAWVKGLFADARVKRERRRYIRIRAKGVSDADIENAHMIDALIKETSKKKKKAPIQKIATDAPASPHGTDAKNTEDAEQQPNTMKKTDGMEWGGAVLPEFEDEMPEYCADGVADIASSLLLKELRSGTRCTVLWYDGREDNAFCAASASSVADFESAYSRFACAPVVPAENRVSRLAESVSVNQNVTVKIVTANLDPVNVGEYCSVPSRFGGAGTGCSTEILLFDPTDRYTSPASRLRYAYSCRVLLRQYGIVMRETEETDGANGRRMIRDRGMR